MLFFEQRSVQEDVFPDAEGWENVDPDEAAKWAMGSEFPTDASEPSQTGAGAATETPTGINISLLTCTTGTCVLFDM